MSARASIMALAVLTGFSVEMGAQSGSQLTDAARLAISKKGNWRIAKYDAAYARAEKLRESQDYEAALPEYLFALTLPDAPVFANRREQFKKAYADTAIELARERASEGRMADAMSLVREVLRPEMVPSHQAAKTLMADWKATVDGQAFLSKLPELDQTFQQGEDGMRLGDYDQAYVTFTHVLSIDRYNSLVRHRLEQVLKYRNAWFFETPAPSDAEVAKIHEKLRTIVLPEVDFEDTPLQTTVDFLKQKSIELDPEPDLTKKGVFPVIYAPNLELDPRLQVVRKVPIFDAAQLPPSDPTNILTKRITFRSSNVSLLEAYRELAQHAKIRFGLNAEGVVLDALPVKPQPEAPQ